MAQLDVAEVLAQAGDHPRTEEAVTRARESAFDLVVFL
jgi:hypothetical protein